jgi:nitric oxide synthase oxygenase domain/subunit
MVNKNNYLYHDQSVSIVDHLLTYTDDLERFNEQQGR